MQLKIIGGVTPPPRSPGGELGSEAIRSGALGIQFSPQLS